MHRHLTIGCQHRIQIKEDHQKVEEVVEEEADRIRITATMGRAVEILLDLLHQINAIYNNLDEINSLP